MKNFTVTIKKNTEGFTLIELIVVIGIILILFGFISINLIQQQHTTAVSASVDTLSSDIASQQTKAMAGKVDSSSAENSYGIYFQSDRYTLFSGNTYFATGSGNFTVMLDKNISFSNITFPNSSLVFSVRSGEFNGFVNGTNTIKIKDTAGSEAKTITVNRYGVIINVN